MCQLTELNLEVSLPSNWKFKAVVHAKLNVVFHENNYYRGNDYRVIMWLKSISRSTAVEWGLLAKLCHPWMIKENERGVIIGL